MANPATVSVTQNNITVSATDGNQPFSAIVTAVNNMASGTITGSGTSGDPWVITTYLNQYRTFTFNSGTDVTFEQNNHITWGTINTTGKYAFYFNDGCKITWEDGVVIDETAGSAGDVYNVFYGEVTITGTESNKCRIKGMSRIYFYSRQEQHLTYLDITDNRKSSGYSCYFSMYSNTASPDCSMNNVRFYNDSGSNGYAFYLSGGGDYSNWTFDNIEVDGLTYAIINYGSLAKFSDSVFKNCVNQILCYNSGNKIGNIYETSKDDERYLKTNNLQPMMTFDTCSFQDMDNGAYIMYVAYNALVHFKDCSFIGDTYSGTQDGVYSRYGARVIWSGTTTFTDIQSGRERLWTTDGTHLHGHELDLTIQDSNGSSIENATVSVIQKSTPAHEIWTGYTNSDGKFLNMFGDNPVFIEKEETSNGNYVDWTTDGHTLLVSKDGYSVETQDIIFDSDKTITVTLQDKGYEGTQIIDSTLYDTTINS